MADIFREIDEDLRRDRARNLWRKYGTLAIACVTLIVLGTAAFTWWQGHQAEQRQLLAERLYNAMDLAAQDGGQANGITALEALGDEASGLTSALARFRAATLAFESGQYEEAYGLYQKIIADTSIDPLYRDLAVLLSVLHAGPGADAAGLLARIEPQTADTMPWRTSAREIAAGLAVRSGDMERAQNWLARIADDPAAPLGARGRAAEILRALGA